MFDPMEVPRLREEIHELTKTIEELQKFVDVSGKLLQQHDQKIKELQLEVGALKGPRSIYAQTRPN